MLIQAWYVFLPQHVLFFSSSSSLLWQIFRTGKKKEERNHRLTVWPGFPDAQDKWDLDRPCGVDLRNCWPSVKCVFVRSDVRICSKFSAWHTAHISLWDSLDVRPPLNSIYLKILLPFRFLVSYRKLRKLSYKVKSIVRERQQTLFKLHQEHCQQY